MVRLNMIVEGQTEEAFVNRLLKPLLANRNVFVAVRCVETGRRGHKIFRGGLLNYEKAKKDITLWMKEDQGADAKFTTMFDLYRLPDNFPSAAKARQQTNINDRLKILEDSFAQSINDHRFIPYIQLHEFEALLFSDIEKLSFYYPDQKSNINKLVEQSKKFANPEHINDGPTTSPSKRIIHELNSYDGDKASAGPEVATQIGLATIRAKCPHFNFWLSQLEELDQPAQ